MTKNFTFKVFILTCSIIVIGLMFSACGGGGGINPEITSDTTPDSYYFEGYLFINNTLSSVSKEVLKNPKKAVSNNQIIRFYKSASDSSYSYQLNAVNGYYSAYGIDFRPAQIRILENNTEIARFPVDIETPTEIEGTANSVRYKQKLVVNRTSGSTTNLEFSTLKVIDNGTKITRKILTGKGTGSNFENGDYEYSKATDIYNIDALTVENVYKRIENEYSQLLNTTVLSVKNSIDNNIDMLLKLDAQNTSTTSLVNVSTYPGAVIDTNAINFKPDKVQNVKATNVTADSATISWDSVIGASSYNIYNGGVLLFESIGGKSKVITGLENGTVYSISVSAKNDVGEGAKSDSVSITTVESSTYGKFLDKISLSKKNIVVGVGLELDLSTVEVKAYYTDGTQKTVEDVYWHILSGQGQIDSGVFYAPQDPGIVKIRCTYRKDGISKSEYVSINVEKPMTSITLSSSTLILKVNQTYDLDNISTIVNYTNGTTKVINGLTWWRVSGEGSIEDETNIFTCPSLIGSTLLRGSYTENGITKTADLTITIEKTLTGISAVPANIQVNINDVFDLSNIKIMINYDDNTSVETSQAIWTKREGPGTLSGLTFTAPGTSGTTYLQVAYTGANVTATAEVVISTQKYLENLTLSQTTLELNFSQAYDLTNITPTAHYDDGSTSAAANAIWTKVSGGGTITGNTFTAAAFVGTTVLRCSYTENSVEKTADLTVTNKKTLTAIAIIPTTGNIGINQIYDLSGITVTAYYDDGTDAEVDPADYSWSVVSGGGVVNGLNFTAPNFTGSTTIRCTHIKDNITATADLSITTTKTLTGITLSLSKVLNLVGTTYDLSSITVNATYNDSTTALVTGFTMNHISGMGSLLGANFTSPNVQDTAEIRFTYTEEGTTVYADFAIGTYTLPTTPTGVIASNIAGDSFDVSWNDVEEAVSYNVYVDGTLYATDVGILTASISGLLNGTTYNVEISAVNELGEGPRSSSIGVLTKSSPPNGLTISSLTTTSYTIEWNTVPNVSEYRIYEDDILIGSAVAPSVSKMIMGRNAETEYIVKVTAINSAGESEKSNPIAVLTLPPAPTNIVASSITETSYTLGWDSVLTATTYQVYENNNLIATVNAPTTSIDLTGKTSGTQFSYQISAINSGGESSRSNPYSVTTLPAIPANLASSSITDTAFVLSWDPVVGADFYTIYDDLGNVVQGNIAITQYNFTGMNPGTEYTYQVTARNSSGEGQKSLAYTALTLSSAPIGITVSNITTSAFQLSWNPSDGATYYRVYDDSDIVIEDNILTTDFTFTGRSSGTQYLYKLTAINSSGESAHSGQIQIWTIPDAPDGLTAADVTSSSFTLDWNATTGASYYNIYDDTNALVLSNVTSSTKTFTGKAANTSYTYKVTAVNAGGESGYSFEYTVTTLP